MFGVSSKSCVIVCGVICGGIWGVIGVVCGVPATCRSLLNHVSSRMTTNVVLSVARGSPQSDRGHECLQEEGVYPKVLFRLRRNVYVNAQTFRVPSSEDPPRFPLAGSWSQWCETYLMESAGSPLCLFRSKRPLTRVVGSRPVSCSRCDIVVCNSNTFL